MPRLLLRWHLATHAAVLRIAAIFGLLVRLGVITDHVLL